MTNQSTFSPTSDLKTNEAIGFSYRAPLRGYRRMGTSPHRHRPGSLQSLPHHGWGSHRKCIMEPIFVLIFHFQLTARFDFVSLSLHSMHSTYTQTHKHTIKTYKLIDKHIDNMQTHRQHKKHINTKKQTHLHTNTHVLRHMILRHTHIYINTHM